MLDRIKERTSHNGAALIIMGVLILVAGPIAKWAAGMAIAYGAYSIWKKED
jgi:hypothetical protein